MSGGLPPGWAWSTVGDLLANGFFTDGDWVESKDQDPDGDIRLLQLADIGEGCFRDRSSRFINKDAADRLNVNFVEPGDVLVARMPDPIGRACLAPTLGQQTITVVDVCILRPEPGIERRWLMWALNSPSTRQAIAALATGTTRKRISRKNLATIGLPVPPLPEQRRIVAAIDEHFSSLDAAEDSLKSAEQRLYQLDVVQSARALVGDWPTLPLEEVASVKAGPFGSSLTKSSYAPSGFKVYGQEQVLRGDPYFGDYFVPEAKFAELQSCAVAPRDLLVSLVGSIGRTLVLPDDAAPGIINPRLVRIRPLDGRVSTDFLQAVLDSPSVQARLHVGAHGGTMEILNATMLKKVQVPVPDSDTQSLIVGALGSMLEQTDRSRHELANAKLRLARLRRSILAAAFSGQLVPQDLSDEPASILLERIAAERTAAKPSRKRKASS